MANKNGESGHRVQFSIENLEWLQALNKSPKVSQRNKNVGHIAKFGFKIARTATIAH
jgi:hypothetical protein